jgi:hypothetical protein
MSLLKVQHQGEPKRAFKFGYVYIVFIFLIGAFLRFNELGFRSMWLDEAWRVAYSKIPLIDHISLKVPNGIILFPLILKAAGNIAGYSELSMRFIPALAGALVVMSGYLLSRQFLEKTPSLIVATLIALSPIGIAYSQEAANYALSMLIVSLLLFFYMRYIDRKKIIYLIFYVIAGVAAVYLHSFSIFIVGGTLIYTILTGRLTNTAKRLYLAYLVIFVCAIPDLISKYQFAQYLRKDSFSSLEALTFSGVCGLSERIIFSWLSGPTKSIYVPLSDTKLIWDHLILAKWVFIGIFAWVILVNLLRWDLKANLLLLCISFYFLALVSLGRTNDRYFLVVMPLFFILLARACYLSWAHWAFRPIVCFVLIGLLLNFQDAYWQNHDQMLWKNDWRGVCNNLRLSVKEMKPNTNFAILVPINYETPLVEFYLPDFRDKILWDPEYQSYRNDPKYIFLSGAKIREFNTKMLKSGKALQADVLYVVTLRGFRYVDDITELKEQFRLYKTEGRWPRLLTYRRLITNRAD